MFGLHKESSQIPAIFRTLDFRIFLNMSNAVD